jgi:hypothetical protein
MTAPTLVRVSESGMYQNHPLSNAAQVNVAREWWWVPLPVLEIRVDRHVPEELGMLARADRACEHAPVAGCIDDILSTNLALVSVLVFAAHSDDTLTFRDDGRHLPTLPYVDAISPRVSKEDFVEPRSLHLVCEVGSAVLQHLMVLEIEVPRGVTTTPAELATALDDEVRSGQLIEHAEQLADPMDRCRKKRFPDLVSGEGLALKRITL